MAKMDEHSILFILNILSMHDAMTTLKSRFQCLTLSWQGYKNDDFGRLGGHSMAPPKISPNEATEACEVSK